MSEAAKLKKDTLHLLAAFPPVGTSSLHVAGQSTLSTPGGLMVTAEDFDCDGLLCITASC